MSTTVRDEKELAKALENNEDTIYVEGDLKNNVIRIKATGKIAWAIAIAAITAVVIIIITSMATGGASAVASAGIAPVAVGILGAPATMSAIGIAVAAGGVGVLNKLRSYDLIQKNGQCILKK